MNNDHKISPSSLSKLSSEQIKELINQGEIVDPAEPEVQKLLKLDATEDPQTGKPFFYPYYESFVLNGYSYLVKEGSLEFWKESMWEQFEKTAVQISSRRAFSFENRLDLEMTSTRSNFTISQAAEAGKNLTSSSAICLEDKTVLSGFQDFITRYLIANLEHVVSGWMTNKTELDDVLIPFAIQLADYYFIEYLKWKSELGIEDARTLGRPFYEIISEIVESKKECIHTSFNDEKPNILTQRELIMLTLLTDKKWTYLIKMGEVQQVYNQFIGILTGFEPVSFANQACRGIDYLNKRDGSYLRNLKRKLTNPKLTKRSLDWFQSTVDEITKILDTKSL